MDRGEFFEKSGCKEYAMEELSEMIFRVSEVEAFGIKYVLRVTAKTDGSTNSSDQIYWKKNR